MYSECIGIGNRNAVNASVHCQQTCEIVRAVRDNNFYVRDSFILTYIVVKTAIKSSNARIIAKFRLKKVEKCQNNWNPWKSRSTLFQGYGIQLL